ncbi:hypothetical protein [Salinibaculum rarum]|uniref:hypothetical protein n=1 Tax=Salinibaculum rarum TaxID=3058903 RepID=UPI00265F00C8|nr:hypothetical protein [Salinibaculum sp. KK48]
MSEDTTERSDSLVRSLEATDLTPSELSGFEKFLILGFVSVHVVFVTSIYVVAYLMVGGVGGLLPVVGVLFTVGLSVIHADRWQLIAIGGGVFGVLPAVVSTAAYLLIF